jgi:hypothetical protein
MPFVKISELPQANTLEGAELVEVVQDGFSRKTTLAAIASQLSAEVGTLQSVSDQGRVTTNTLSYLSGSVELTDKIVPAETNEVQLAISKPSIILQSGSTIEVYTESGTFIRVIDNAFQSETVAYYIFNEPLPLGSVVVAVIGDVTKTSFVLDDLISKRGVESMIQAATEVLPTDLQAITDNGSDTDKTISYLPGSIDLKDGAVSFGDYSLLVNSFYTGGLSIGNVISVTLKEDRRPPSDFPETFFEAIIVNIENEFEPGFTMLTLSEPFPVGYPILTACVASVPKTEFSDNDLVPKSYVSKMIQDALIAAGLIPAGPEERGGGIEGPLSA